MTSTKSAITYRVVAIQYGIVIGAALILMASSQVFPFLPDPISVVAAIFDILGRTTTYSEFALTLYETFTGYIIAAILGVSVGIAIGANRTLTEILNPMVLAIYSVPKIIFLPLLMIILGVGVAPKIANAALHAFFPIVLNALVGMREVDIMHKKVARSLDATTWQTVSHVYIPSMILPVFAGLRLGLGLAFMGAILAELFESEAGVGHMVHQFYNELRIAEMFAVILVLFLVILLLNSLTKALESRLTRWRQA